jgi:coenzyme PQQ precursor peptide PqqA
MGEGTTLVEAGPGRVLAQPPDAAAFRSGGTRPYEFLITIIPLTGWKICPESLGSRSATLLGSDDMAWTAPKLEEVTCGMEINMYFPAEDDPVLF